MKELVQQLQQAGLTRNESKIYFELLKRGSLPASDLSKKLAMDRTLAYQILNHLIDKGLVNYIIKSKKKFFEVADPQALLNSTKEKIALIQDLIPKLQEVKQVQESTNEVQIYEGKEGLRTFINLALKEKEFCSFGATGKAFDILYEMPRAIEQMKKEGKKVRIIGSEKSKNNKAFQSKAIEYRSLKVNNKSTTSIFGNHVAIHTIRDIPKVIIIESKEISQTYKEYFEVLWNVAK